MNNKKRRLYLVLSFIIIGIITYYLFDIKVLTKSNVVFTIIRNFLPDVCWTISFFFMSIRFATNITKKYILLTSLYVFCIALLFELLQFFKIVKGTFDILDVITYTISIILACLIEILIRRKENEKSS